MSSAVNKALSDVQKSLKAPKNQFNSFGKYSYRSAEDILEAAKPLCIKNGLVLTVSDDVCIVGGRIYVRAEAKVTCIEDGESVSVCGYAREPEAKKGMDDSQITGTASSYARKYALNGLFCIDDTKDADTDDYRNQQQRSKPPAKPEVQAKQEEIICKECGEPVKPAKKRDGSIATAQQIYESCNGMCLKCYGEKKQEGK